MVGFELGAKVVGKNDGADVGSNVIVGSSVGEWVGGNTYSRGIGMHVSHTAGCECVDVKKSNRKKIVRIFGRFKNYFNLNI